MCLPHATKLVTDKYGLAFNPCPSASPYHVNGDWIAVSAGECPRAAAGGLSEYPQSGWSGRRWYPSDVVRMEGVETRRSHPYQQLVEKQNGQRHQKAVRQRRGLHNVGSPDRPRHCRDWLLAIRQLLVTRPRGSRHHRGLTNSQTSPESRHSYQRRKRLFIDDITSLKSRKRLAASRAL